jgi:hypothetical protein
MLAIINTNIKTDMAILMQSTSKVRIQLKLLEASWTLTSLAYFCETASPRGADHCS